MPQLMSVDQSWQPEEKIPGESKRKRVVIVQAVIPLYNVPLFERLAAIPDLDLVVLADLETANSLNQYDASAHQFRAMHLGAKRRGRFIFRPGLIRMLKELAPQAVVINPDPAEVTQNYAILWCRMAGIPVGIWSMCHRVGPPLWRSELHMRGLGMLANRVLTYGARGRREQIRRGTPQEKIVVLSTAIDEQRVLATRATITPDEVEAVRERNHLNGKRVLLQVVRMTPIKHTDILIQAFDCLLRRRDDVVLVLIGGGPQEAAIKQQVRELGIDHAVRFLGSIYDEREVGVWYMLADVFVMATCVGLSIHHAMCYGLPVVTDDNELTQATEYEVLRSGVNGFAFRSGDFADFADKIEILLADDRMRAEFGRAGTETILHDYSLAHKVRNFSRAIHELIDLNRKTVQPSRAWPGTRALPKAETNSGAGNSPLAARYGQQDSRT